MAHISAEALVAMPRSEAWAKLRDLTLSRHYVPGVTDIEITTPNRTGLGASRKVYCKGRPPLDETVVDWEEGHGFTVKLHEGDKPASPFRSAEFVYRLDDAPQGRTRVTTVMIYELPFGVLGRLLDGLLMRHVVARTVGTISRNLQHVYENGPAEV